VKAAPLAGVLGLAALAACGPQDPCAAAGMRLVALSSAPYAGRWVVARGDTLTLPEMGDRFRMTEIDLDTNRVRTAAACRFRGAIVFAAPRRETLAVTWIGHPEQAFIFGWPADLGPFGGLGTSVRGDTLRGALLFDSRLGVRMPPGVTAQFVAGRSQPR
jgi:hypothetical protein